MPKIESVLISHGLFFLSKVYVRFTNRSPPSNQHFKAFPVSIINSETSFLYQLFKENLNFIVSKPWKVIYLSIFILIFLLLFIFIHIFIYAFTHLNINIQGTLHICMYACMYVYRYYVWKENLTRWLSTDVFHSWPSWYAFDPETTSDIIIHGVEVSRLDCE